MGFFSQAGRKKKKEQPHRAGEVLETGRAASGERELEKTMFLTPEERYVSKNKKQYGAPEDEGELSESGRIRLPRYSPIIVNGADYLLRINETRMEALLTLYRRFSAEEIRGLLKENGVVFGIWEKTLTEMAEGKLNYEETLVATGTAARDGRDGYFAYHFNPQPETRPIILPDGTVDYNVLGKIELVTEGQLLVTYHAAMPAVTGRDVLGNTIDAYEGKGLPPLQCKRCEPDETGSQYFASTEGNVTLEGRCLTVTPIYVIEGNLDAATGDVDFHGDVLIQGNVFADVTVKQPAISR